MQKRMALLKAQRPSPRPRARGQARAALLPARARAAAAARRAPRPRAARARARRRAAPRARPPAILVQKRVAQAREAGTRSASRASARAARAIGRAQAELAGILATRRARACSTCVARPPGDGEAAATRAAARVISGVRRARAARRASRGASCSRRSAWSARRRRAARVPARKRAARRRVADEERTPRSARERPRGSRASPRACALLAARARAGASGGRRVGWPSAPRASCCSRRSARARRTARSATRGVPPLQTLRALALPAPRRALLSAAAPRSRTSRPPHRAGARTRERKDARRALPQQEARLETRGRARRGDACTGARAARASAASTVRDRALALFEKRRERATSARSALARPAKGVFAIARAAQRPEPLRRRSGSPAVSRWSCRPLLRSLLPSKYIRISCWANRAPSSRPLRAVIRKRDARLLELKFARRRAEMSGCGRGERERAARVIRGATGRASTGSRSPRARGRRKKIELERRREETAAAMVMRASRATRTESCSTSFVARGGARRVRGGGPARAPRQGAQRTRSRRRRRRRTRSTS